ncbi:kinase-like domain-containing protein [Rhizophagus irregularis DAOM 181602=DAOM 197198]|nr:kinase-like domain-containing protein [Rhizophagus irregularis DAOM 181602=DAOM 197198]
MQDTEYTNEQEFNDTSLSTNNSELQGDLSQLIHYFDKMNIKEIDPIARLNKQENFAIEDFNIIVDEIHDFIFKLINKGLEINSVKQQVIEYFNNYDLNSHEVYNWLLDNKNSSNSIFILGYFDYYGIEINKNDENAFNLFINASEKNHILAQYFIAVDKNFTPGQVSIGYCYEKGIGVEKDLKKAFYWYEIAANNGSLMAILY